MRRAALRGGTSSLFLVPKDEIVRSLSGFLLIALLLVLLSGSAGPAQAQTAPGPLTCPEMVQAALTALEANCTGVGRNTACYANTLVQSAFTQPVPDDYFSRPADLAEIVALRSLVTAPMDTANDVWGIALLNLQANLPGTLPGQSVTMLVMGDAVVGNAVPEDAAALPVEPSEVVTQAEAEVRTLPQADAPLAGVATAGEVLAADARTPDNLWVRVVVPAEPAFGGWVGSAALAPFELAQLPVVDANTRTPMQAFVFRTGIGAPACAEAPNSVIVQGPNNTQVVMNVNGADLTVGSTVRLSSVSGAPQEIIDLLDLPDDVAEQLNDADEQAEGACGVMAMDVLSGSVEVNDGDAVLPAGNTAYAVACEDEPPASGPESTPEPGAPPELPGIGFSSDWGAFGQMSEEELQSLAPLEQIEDTILNYQINLPDPNNIQPPITATPTPTPRPPGGGVGFVPTATPTPVLTATPTPNPTIPPGTGLSTNVVIDFAANNQTAVVGGALPVPFSVRITDPYGGASIGVPVTFSAPASGPGGVFLATGTNTQTVNTDQSGNAVASPFITNTIAGAYTVTATAPRDVGFFAFDAGKLRFGKPPAQLALIDGAFNVTNAPGAPSQISPDASGNNLSATVATAYSAQPAVLITDDYGNPVPFVPVTFTAQVGGSGASGLFGASAVANSATGFDGVARAPFLTANTTSGAFQIAVTSPAGAVNLDMTNLPGAPVNLSATFGSGQSATVGTAFPSFLTALVIDTYGNPVPDVSVTFTAPASGPGAGFLGSGTNSETVSTDSAGNAVTTAVIANTVSGTYSVGASAGALNTSFGLTNTAGAPATMTITGGNSQSATVNTAFAAPLSVNVVDSFGNPTPGIPVTFSAPGSGASGTFGGPNPVNTDGSGNATSPTLSANTVAGAYTISAASGAASASFNLTNIAGAPALMSATGGSGQSVLISTTFPTPFSVTVTDAFGNINAGVPVTFSAPGSGASGTFGGLATVNTNGAGSATSPSFTANGTAGAYSVTATSGAASTTFSLTNLNPGATLTSINPSSITAGSGGFALTLGGAGFVPGMQVTWTGQVNLTATVGSATSATVNIPASYIAAPGTPSVNVTNPGPGGGTAAGPLTFTVTAPPTVVTSLADSGPGSLRQVVTDALPGSTITFGVTGTITLTSGIGINKNLTINGPGAALTLSGNNASRIFETFGPATVNFNNLRLTAGYTPGGFDGGALYVHLGSTVNISGTQFNANNVFGNSCCEKGGAIFSEGALTITNSSFTNNSAVQMASAVAAWPTGTSLSITNSCLLNNTGAGNYAVSSSVPSTISGNWWGNPGGPGAGGVNSSIPTDSAPAAAPIPGVPGC
jgi:predicted outer membrane repeat protein